VIQLQALAAQFKQLQQYNVDAQNAMTAVTQMWAGLQQDLQDTMDELTATESDVTAAQYTQAQSDLGQAALAWSAVVTYAQALANVNYNWQDSSGAWHKYGDGTQIQESGATVTMIQQAA
jgi:predicted  nucleic acid-binding Zn-ribbon protein